MALIVCPECRRKFSTHATSCPRCGFPLAAILPLSDDGLSAAPHPSVESADTEQFVLQKKRKRIAIAVIATFLGAVCIISCVAASLISKRKEMARQEAAQQQLLAEQERAMQEAQEEQERLRARAEYISNLHDFSQKVAEGNVLASYVCYTTKSVWFDSIFHEDNEDTAAYTQTDGKFHEDFNDSLDKLYASTEITNAFSQIADNREAVAKLYKSLMHPTSEFEDCFDAVEDVYSVYLDMTRLAMVPSGSLESYSKEYLAYYNDCIESFEKLTPLIPDE